MNSVRRVNTKAENPPAERAQAPKGKPRVDLFLREAHSSAEWCSATEKCLLCCCLSVVRVCLSPHVCSCLLGAVRTSSLPITAPALGRDRS